MQARCGKHVCPPGCPLPQTNVTRATATASTARVHRPPGGLASWKVAARGRQECSALVRARACRSAQDLLRVRDQRDQVAHLALDLRHRGHQARRCGCLRHPDVEADVGPAVVLEVSRPRPSSRPARRAGRAARRRPAPPPGSSRRSRSRPDSRAPPRRRRRAAWRPPPPAGVARRRTCPRCGRDARRDGRSGPASSAPGEASSARSPADRRGRARRAACSPPGNRPRRMAVPSRSTVSSNAVGGRTGLNTVCEGGVAIHGLRDNGTAAPPLLPTGEAAVVMPTRHA